ncbi:MAG TPA: pyridoxal 5'-phosphate synthase glutaminase subunit PdxT [Candidatus Limnocylindria bacterium]|nr:pyridoxal 5'-phosphate synthase glutaminase subunit PdxT [Candidatus Limnocylindria bacterium]
MVDRDRRPRVGILALQGDVAEHAAALRAVGADPVEVRLPRDLAGVEALILPGGESTAMRKLIDAYGLAEPILSLAASGAPMWGTCAGMILLARRIADGDPPVLPLIDIEVRRNAYGRQLDSFEADLDVPTLGAEPFHAVFIRAPVVTDVGAGVEVLATDPMGRTVAVREGRLLATAFHPELTGDRRFHGALVELVGAKARA